MRIERLHPDHAVAVAELFARSRSAAMPWLPVLHTPAEDRAFFGRALTESAGIGAWDGGALLGFAVTRPGWLDHLYVEPDRRGEGIGTLLLEAVLADRSGPVPEATPDVRDPISLWAFQRNQAARAFYARRGFVEVETTDGSGNEEGEPDVLLRGPV